MNDVINRIKILASRYNNLIDSFYAITPISSRIEPVYKKYNDYIIMDLCDEEGYYEDEEVLYNTLEELKATNITFPQSEEFILLNDKFNDDCDFLIQNKKDTILIALMKLFKQPEIYPTTDQFISANMYDEQLLLEILHEIGKTAREYASGHSDWYDAIDLRRKQLEEEQAFNKRASNDKCKNTEIKLPPELNNEQAKIYFQRAIDAGFMNNDYSWNYKNGTKAQQALFAEIASEKLSLKFKFKIFETLWSIKHLAQTRGNSRDKMGKVNGSELIDKIFI